MQATGVKGFHLSIQQMRVWSLQQEGRAYRAQCTLLANEHLDRAVFLRVLQYLIDRHDILRTAFYCLPGMDVPLQIVSDQVEASYQVIDLERLSRVDQQHQCEVSFTALQVEELDLEYDSQFYVGMLNLSDNAQALLLSLPALCADTSTLSLLVSELCQCYTAFLNNESPDNDLPLQYADVSAWQNTLLDADETASGRRYWQEKDVIKHITMRLPFVQEDEHAKSFPTVENLDYVVPQSLTLLLEEASVIDLKALSQLYRVSPATVLLALWLVCLWRLDPDQHITIGVACDGRNHEELTTALGHYTRSVPFSIELANELSFAQVIVLVNQHFQDTLKQQMYFSWETAMPPQEAGSSTPHGFPLSFAYERWPDHLSCGPARLSLVRLDVEGEPSALKLQVLDLDTTLRVHLLYDPRRLQQEQVKRLGQAFMVLLQHALTEPARTVGSLPLVTAAQQEQLVRLASGPHLPLPSAGVSQIFEAHAQRHPERLAVQSPVLSLRYKQLNARANQLARRLQSLGVGPNVLVGLCLERSALAVVGILGVLKAGGAYVPLDGEQPRERLGQLMQESQISVLVTSSALRTHLPAFAGVVLDLDAVDSAVTQVSSENLPQRSQGEDLAYVLYTSGSTGRPKGVQVRRCSLLNYSLGLLEHLPREQGLHFALVSTLAADLGNSAIYGALVSGGCVDVLDAETVTSASAMATWMREHPVDVLKIVPSHLEALLGREQGAEILPSRVLILGGEVASASVLRQIWASGADCRVLNHYGPTEVTVGALVQPLTPGVEQGALGRPLANTQVYVLDRDLQLVPAGSRGEICLGGEGIAQGYLGEAGQTAERFVPHAWSQEAGQRLYRTGDMGWMNARGEIEFVGRTDQQVKVRGYRVELAEVEAALRRQTTIRAAAVQVESHGQAGARLVGYVVPRVQPGPRLEEVQAALYASLPAYMIPSHLEMLEELPLTPNGKVDRRRLASGQAVAGVSRDVRMQQPGSPVEEVLQEIWQELLEVPWIGRQEDFFRLGGHSLLAMQVISQIRARLRVELSIVQVFEVPTIAGLASKIERVMRGGHEDEEPVLGRVEREEEMPVSFAQQRLWVLEQLEPGSVAYLTPHRVKIVGRLRVEALEWSLGEVMARHEVLRSCFVERGGEPRQQVRPVGVWLPLIDLEGLGREEAERAAQLLGWQEGQRALDLRSGPVVRSTLIRLGGEHILLLTLHHIVTDGWSNQILVRELGLLYGAFEAGHASPLAPLPVQYIDFAVWQRRWLQGERFQAQLMYWTHCLADLTQLDLPLDYTRPPVQRFRGAFLSRYLPAALRDKVVVLSQRANATLFMTLLAAFQLLLMRYSGQTDVAVGTPIANRTRAELDGLIGFFVNTLVLRTDLSGNPTFHELLARVCDVALHAYAHQDVPFERIVEELQPERDLSRSPLFQVMFSVIQPELTREVWPSALILKEENSEMPAAKFDLELNIVNSERGLLCGVIYNTDLFTATTIQRLLDCFQNLLEGIVERPDQKIPYLPLLGPSARQQVLIDWNATQRDYPWQSSFAQLFTAQVSFSPDAIALQIGEHQVTYSDLERRANQLACHLQTLGVGSDVLVGIYMDRSIEMVLSILGIWKAGGAYLPLEPSYPQTRIAYMLQHASVHIVIAHSSFYPQLSQQSITSIMCLDLDWQTLNSAEKVPLSLDDYMEQLAYVIYTSGSTGRPKGVMVTQGGMLNHLLAKVETLDLTSQDVVAQTASHCFDISIWQFFAVWLRGGRVNILPDEITHEPSRLFAEVDAKQITIVEVVPALLRAFLDTEELSLTGLLGLRWLIATGEQLVADLGLRWLQRYSRVALLNAYGPTECADDVTHAVVDAHVLAHRIVAPIGRAIANTQIYLLDEFLEPIPPGVTGQIYVGGAGVGRGYLGEVERTALSFIPDLFSQQPGKRLYKTGDIGRYSMDGQIEFVRRYDDQVKVRGYRIELGEIEAVLAENPLIKEQVVVTRGDSPDNQILLAYVVGQNGFHSMDELRSYLRERLPSYMVPNDIILLSTLPLTPNGKIDRGALPVPETDQMLEPRAEIAITTSIEELLSGIWCEILRRPQVGRHDNFFMLGGHSLLATQLLSRIRSVFGVELALRSIFEASVLSDLAQRIEDELRDAQPVKKLPLMPVVRNQALPLSFAQQRLWFIDQLDPGNSAYNVSLAIHFLGRLHIALLEQSMYEMVKRHESLRTVFGVWNEQPVQIIQEPVPVQLPVIDISGITSLPFALDKGELQHLIHQERQQSFDLVNGPLWRMTLVSLNANEHILLLSMHHIITDGWSMNILMREMSSIYRSIVLSEPIYLAPLPIQYVDFAYWQRQWLQGEVLQEQLAYWTRLLRGSTPLKLPVDHSNLESRSYRGGECPLSLSRDLSNALKALSRQEGVTLFMTLLAAFQTLLYRYTGQTDIIVGTDMASRTHLETEALIGFFINILALRNDLSGSPSFREVLRKTRTLVLDVYAHQDAPFEMVVEQIAPDHRLDSIPLVQVLFVLHNQPASYAQELPGVTQSSLLDVETLTAKFELALFMLEGPDGLRGMLKYRRDLFDSSTVATMMERFTVLLQHIVAEPDTPIDILRFYTETERRQQAAQSQKALRSLKRARGEELYFPSE